MVASLFVAPMAKQVVCPPGCSEGYSFTAQVPAAAPPAGSPAVPLPQPLQRRVSFGGLPPAEQEPEPEPGIRARRRAVEAGLLFKSASAETNFKQHVSGLRRMLAIPPGQGGLGEAAREVPPPDHRLLVSGERRLNQPPHASADDPLR